MGGSRWAPLTASRCFYFESGKRGTCVAYVMRDAEPKNQRNSRCERVSRSAPRCSAVRREAPSAPCPAGCLRVLRSSSQRFATMSPSEFLSWFPLIETSASFTNMDALVDLQSSGWWWLVYFLNQSGWMNPHFLLWIRLIKLFSFTAVKSAFIVYTSIYFFSVSVFIEHSKRSCRRGSRASSEDDQAADPHVNIHRVCQLQLDDLLLHPGPVFPQRGDTTAPRVEVTGSKGNSCCY